MTEILLSGTLHINTQTINADQTAPMIVPEFRIFRVQGSNLALANLLNASSFVQKQATCYFQHVKTSPYYINKAMQHGKQHDPDQPTSLCCQLQGKQCG